MDLSIKELIINFALPQPSTNLAESLMRCFSSSNFIFEFPIASSSSSVGMYFTIHSSGNTRSSMISEYPSTLDLRYYIAASSGTIQLSWKNPKIPLTLICPLNNLDCLDYILCWTYL